MKDLKLEINLKLAQLDELSDDDQQLIKLAKQATAHSFSPYSHFKVGAAARLANGKTFIGANQENAAFPSGLCAERTALYAAQANCPAEPVTTLAIAARNSRGFMKLPISPCGGCRQVMIQVEDRYQQPMRILLYGADGVYCFDSAKDLMPFHFVDANMR